MSILTGESALAPADRQTGLRGLRHFYDSLIGKKIIMGLTGVVMVLFVMQHMLGNLVIYQSTAMLNTYAFFLKSKPGLVWPARLVLLATVVLHATTAWQLAQRSRRARPHGYAMYEPQASTFASRTIRWGGVGLLLFIVFHILHLTTGTILPATFQETDAAGNVIRGFRHWWVSAIYLAAMGLLVLHLYHGLYSSPRTLGAVRPFAPMRRAAATVIALAVGLGFASIPLAVLAGILR